MAPRCFDPARAAHPTRVLPVGEVVDLLELTHAPERIEAYRDAMRRGDLFPPVAVIQLLGRHVLADGHKRLSAYRSLGHPEILVEVWPPRRWLRDQAQQAARNVRKNRRILAQLFVDRREATRLMRATLGHWRRVALSLAGRAGLWRRRTASGLTV